MSEFDSFFAAIGGQESGGNYGAVNSRTGASGKYQIMPSNIGPWSQQYLGYKVTLQQFQASPQIQDQLARAVLQSYFNQYGARGAAAAWYSGNPNSQGNYKRFRSNEPSVGEYVDQVLGRMGKSRTAYEAAGAQALAAQQAQNTPSGAPQGPLGLSGADVRGIGLAKADGTSGVTSGMGLGAATGGTPVGTPAAQSRSTQTSSGSTASGLRQAVVEKAMSLMGTPYVWGGASQGGTDCSGLTLQAYGSIGVGLNHYHADQLALGTRTPISQLKPGDLIGWSGLAHVAMYIGNGQIVEAARPGVPVRVRAIGQYDQSLGVYGVSMSKYLGD